MKIFQNIQSKFLEVGKLGKVDIITYKKNFVSIIYFVIFVRIVGQVSRAITWRAAGTSDRSFCSAVTFTTGRRPNRSSCTGRCTSAYVSRTATRRRRPRRPQRRPRWRPPRRRRPRPRERLKIRRRRRRVFNSQ